MALFSKSKKANDAAEKEDEELTAALSARLNEVVIRRKQAADLDNQNNPTLQVSISHVEEAASPTAPRASAPSPAPAAPDLAAPADAAMAPFDAAAAPAVVNVPANWPSPVAAPAAAAGLSKAPVAFPADAYADVPARVAGAAPVETVDLRRAAPPTPAPSTLDPGLGQLSPFAINPDEIDSLLQETARRIRSMGSVNILVAGQTGVGKSTLINAVFGEQFAKTAAGRPVTQNAEWFSSESVPLRILDTRGLEAKDYEETLQMMRSEIEHLRAQQDERDQLHLGWVCISSPSSRVQDCEVDIVRILNKYDIPAIVVLTKDDDDEEFAVIVGQIMVERRAEVAGIVPVRALSKPKRGSAGLEDLVAATFKALPQAHRSAFAAAQKINRDMNRSAAEDYVTAAASAAAAAAVIPVPFSDMVTLAPIQASMLVGISNAFGLAFEKPQVMQLISTVLGCLAISQVGQWAVGTALKFIPGPGSILGAALNATVAGAMTKTLGTTYIRFLYSFIETNSRAPTSDEVQAIFPGFFKARRDA